MSLLSACGQEMWARNVPVTWQLSIAAALGSFFPITFALRQVHVSDTRKFPWKSSVFSLERFVLAVVVPFFAPWPCGPVESLSCACLSCLTHSLAVEDNISFYSLPCHLLHELLLTEVLIPHSSWDYFRISLLSILPPSATSSHLSNINLVRRISPVVLLSSLSTQLFFFLFVHQINSFRLKTNNFLILNILWIMLGFIITCFCLIQLWLCFWVFFTINWFLSGLVNQTQLSSYLLSFLCVPDVRFFFSLCHLYRFSPSVLTSSKS